VSNEIDVMDDAIVEEPAPSARRRGLGLRRLGGNAARTFVAQMGASLCGMLIGVLLARTLGSQANGTYAIAILLPNMLFQLMSFGIIYANVYYIASGQVSARETIRTNLWLWGLISGAGLAISAGILYFKGAAWFPGIPMTLLIVAVLSFPPSLLQSYIQSIFQGFQDFKRYNYLTVVVQATVLVLSAVAILGFHLGVAASVVAYLVGQLLSLAITWWLVRPYIAASPKPKSGEHESWWHYGRRAWNYGWKQHLSAVIQFVNLRMDLFFVNMFLLPAVAGVYNVSVQLGEAMWIVSKVVSTVLLPRLAQLHDQEQTRLELTPLITRLVFFFTLVASIVVGVLGIWLIPLIWGPSFSGASIALAWLLPGIVMGSATRIIAYDFSARGRPEYNSYLAVPVVVINIAANLILIPRVGMIGGSIATTLAYTANTVATLFLYRRFNDLPWHKVLFLQRADVVLLRDAGALALAKARPGRPAQ
jgi:O-antigen/teichoic acid export membrane protein